MNTNLEKNNQLTVAEKIATDLSSAGITETKLIALKSYLELKANAHISEDGHLVEDKNATEEISIARKECKNIRIAIEKHCKSLRDSANAYIKENRAKELEFLGMVEPIENYLQEQENIPAELKKQIEEKKEAEAKQLFTERANELLQYSATFDGNNYKYQNESVSAAELKFMDESVFKKVKSNFKAAFDAEQKRLADIEAERKAEAAKQEEIRIANEKESARLKAIQDEQDRKAKELQEAQDKLNRQLKAKRSEELKPYIVFIRDYNALISMGESEFQKEFAEVKKGAQLQWDYDAKEAKRLEAEKRDKEEKADHLIKILLSDGYVATDASTYKKGDHLITRQFLIECTGGQFTERCEEIDAKIAEAKKLAEEKEHKRIARMPDKKLLTAFVKDFNFNAPACKTEEGKAIVEKAEKMFGEMIDFIINESVKL